MNTNIVKAHCALLGAGCMWGLMSPIGKAAMSGGISSLSLTTMRMVGAAVCFWIASLFAPKERVSARDLRLLFFAGLLGIVFNQGLFIFGLSLTSPVDAAIITTALPIITMVLAALLLKEAMSRVKIAGVILGATGALIFILSNSGGVLSSGSVAGDLMCIGSQISFACYLTVFKGLISRHNIFTLMKWMFTYASICFIPFSFQDLSVMAGQTFPTTVWLEVGFVVLFGTFVAYMLVMVGQKALSSTVVSMYNYVQPIVGAGVSVIIGMGVFGWSKAFATALIFGGVYVVTQNKKREK